MANVRVLSISTLFPTPARPSFGLFVANQMRALAESGLVDCTMVCPIGAPPWPLSNREPYKTHLKAPEHSILTNSTLPVWYPRFRLIPLIGATKNPARIAHAILPLVKALHAEKPFDLIDAQFFYPDGPAAAIIAQELNLPFSIKARGSDIHYWAMQTTARQQIIDAANKASALLSVSKALKEDMIALGMNGQKIRVHYTGLDHERFTITPRQEARLALSQNSLALTIPEISNLLVTPGALIPIKGQELALRALHHCPEYHLAFAGSGPDQERLENLAHNLGLGTRVHFCGQVSHADLPTLLSAADAMILPSEREGLANVWIETLACGTPLLIPDIGGAREVLRNPSAGILTERTPESIATALHTLIAANYSQVEVAQNVTHFSWEHNAQQLARIWADIKKGRDLL